MKPPECFLQQKLKEDKQCLKNRLLKIAICRALIKNPSLIIIDEATSNLDTESEKEIIKLIEEQKKAGKTIISIAHRLSTVEKCDKIFLFEKGQILEQGNFEELKNKKGAFMKMWNR